MKVFEIDTLPKPPGSPFRCFATLGADINEFNYLEDEFRGSPYSKEWKQFQLFYERPKYPKADFSTFTVGCFVCNERAVEIAGEPLEMSGELLPVMIKGETQEFFIHNITNCIDVFDPARTEWRYFGENREYREIAKPAFLSKRFGEETLFKIPEDFGIRMYCLERTGDPDDGEFKAVVEKHKLTGLGFKLVWTDET